jgi:flagellar basal-body rod modification protein FlgD
MDISGITNTSASQASTVAQAGTGQNIVTQEEFLKLFTAQLKAQNPLNPMDSTGFTAQLAQFSSLEQLTNINAGLKSMLSSQTSLQNTMTTSLIGKQVKVAGNTVQLNGQANMQYSLPAAAAKVTISVYDAKGALVGQQDITNQSAGEHTAVWDGRDTNGLVLPSGQYSFSLAAVDSSGNAINAVPLTYGTVTSVSFENNTTYLNIDGTRKVQLGDILEIGGV